MDWRAANDQRRQAQLRLFYMFVVMGLLAIEGLLDARQMLAFLSVERGDPRATGNLYATKPPPERAYAVIALLCAATLALQRLDATTRAPYERMNLAYMLTRWLAFPARTCPPADQCDLPGQRLDSS